MTKDIMGTDIRSKGDESRYLSIITKFTLFNTRQFYLSMRDPLQGKGLTLSLPRMMS